MPNFAIIETGGKQYLVKPGSKLKIENVPSDKNNAILFDRVILKAEGDSLQIGAPYLDKAQVEAKMVRVGRDPKKIVFKYSSKARYKKKKGHRQEFVEVEITKI